jgi:integrase
VSSAARRRALKIEDYAEDPWVAWLRQRTDMNWLPGQWDQMRWAFNADPKDPRNTVTICLAQGCSTRVVHGRLCALCYKAYKTSGRPYEEFLRGYVPTRKKRHPESVGVEQCVVENDRRCPRREYCDGLCLTHYNAWRRWAKKGRGLTLKKWLSKGSFVIPAEALPSCAVPRCTRDAYHRSRILCSLHYHRHKVSQTKLDPAVWAQSESAYVTAFEFGLEHLEERLRWEVLYGLQKRVARGGRIDPSCVRAAMDVMRQHSSFATLSETETLQILDQTRESGTASLLAEMARLLRSTHDEMTGVAPHERLVWDLVEVGALTDPAIHGGTRRRKGLDFGQITQPWLRTLAMDTCRNLKDNLRINPLYKATVIASQVLDQRSDRGMDMSCLGFHDADAIADAIGKLKKRGDIPCASAYKRQLYLKFFLMIADGRRRGLLDELPSSFGRDRSHAIPVEVVEGTEEYGKSLPVVVVDQLDRSIDEIGRNVPYRGLTDAQRHLMLSTIYMVIRDTGRRTKEIASLKRTYLTKDSNGPILIYDNHKAGRMGRRLPITQSTADILKRWMRVRNRLPNVHPPSRDYLFPAHTPHKSYICTYTLGAAIRKWVNSLEQLDGPERDKKGNPVPFDRSKINARALRHTYAQRHADSGTPVDVLRVLMDHTSVQTTGLYYVVTTDRKREAIKTVGKYTIDRSGRARPLTDETRYQLRSVAVPFGNCVEPSNVKAGGDACPIRFQCAGCGFYRPDPSFIPAIEEHLNSLRGDRESALAIDAAAYVVDNFNAQIASFEDVLEQMRKRLDELPTDERNRIEDASIVLRKIRAGASLPLSDISRRELSSDDR